MSQESPRTYRFLDDLCAANDNKEFLSSLRKTYPKELESKVEHRGKRTTFLDLDITVEDCIFI